MSEKKHTHVAVHAIQRHDAEGNLTEVAPGAEFTPRDAAERDFLEARGAAKRKAKEAVAEEGETEKQAKNK